MNIGVFKRIYYEPFAKFRTMSDLINDIVSYQSELVDNLFALEMDLLDATVKYEKPTHEYEESLLLQPILESFENLDTFKSSHANTDYAEHINLVHAGCEIFKWVNQTNVYDLIHTVNRDVLVYAERISPNFRHEIWIKIWMEVINSLSRFILSNYNTGLKWQGTHCLPQPTVLGDTSNIHTLFDHLALFREINQRDNILKVLKHVTTSHNALVTYHKQQEEPDQQFEVKRWIIKHKSGDPRNLVVHPVVNNSVYIFNCINTSLVFENNVKIIRMDSCKRVSLLLKNIAKVVELMDCKEINVHGCGFIPKFNVDTSENINIYISQKSMNISIYTTKSTGVKVHFPHDDGKFRSFPIASQLLTTIEPNFGVKTIVIARDMEKTTT